MPRKHEITPKFLSILDARRLIDAAGNIHHRTIITFLLRSGLRREELSTFPLSYVFNPDAKGIYSKNVSIHLDPEDGTGMKTKGSKARTIWIQRETMQTLFRYAKNYRGERASLSELEQSSLFLNQEGVPFADGGKGLEDIVRTAGKKIGVKAYPHILRHTYATHTLNLLQRAKGRNGMEPLVFLQKQLGHASIEQTMKYSHLVKALADDAVLDYDNELNASEL